MANNFFNFIELKYDEITKQINTWLSSIYKKSDILFNSASPYGQIVNICKELFQHNIIYLKNALNQIDIQKSTHKRVITNIIRISGYNPTRPISATGTLKFKLKQGVDIEKEIKDSIIIFGKKTHIKNKSNGLNYTIEMNTDKNIFPINKNYQFFVSAIQGKYETQTFTGKGVYNQTFSVNIPTSSNIENFNYTIRYNGILLEVKDHMYDMLINSYSCYVRTGFNGGLDIYFGNNNYGFIPEIGSLIEVEYLLSDGSNGEILNSKINDWKFVDNIYDGQNNLLNVEKIFDISIETDFNFASDGDDSNQMKNIIPYVSRNFVLATPSQFIFHLKKLNMFSKVNAFNKLEDNNFSITETVIEESIKKISASINGNSSNVMITKNLNNFLNLYSKYKTNLNDNEIYLYLIPNIKKYFNDNINYFNVPFDVFYLDDNEIDKIMKYLRQIGTTSITTEIKIIQPVITRYIMHIYVRRFSYANEDNIKQEIISNVSDYLLSNERLDRIPKSDFVSLLKEIYGVDSVSVYFVSQKNEDYHKKAIDLGYANPSKQPKYISTKISNVTAKSSKNIVDNEMSKPMIIKNGVYTTNIAYNQELTLGIDPIHGDIIVEQDEYAIIRGGFRDRNGVWYNENPLSGGLSSINVTFNGITEK
jgi:hypothetical protein